MQSPVASSELQSEALDIPSDALAHDIQKQFWKDPSLMSFYEYLSGSGAFNIPQLAPDMWHRYEDQYAAQAQCEVDQEVAQDIPFINIKLLENPEFV